MTEARRAYKPTEEKQVPFMGELASKLNARR